MCKHTTFFLQRDERTVDLFLDPLVCCPAQAHVRCAVGECISDSCCVSETGRLVGFSELYEWQEGT